MSVLWSRLTKRYTDASDVPALAAMLEEKEFRNRNDISLLYPDAYFARPVRGVPYPGERDTKLKTGILAQMIDTKTIRRADQSTPVEANGVVYATTGKNAFIWSPFALMWAFVAGTATQAVQQIYLGKDGVMTFTQPETGWVQRIGQSIAYDANLNKFWVLVRPDVGVTVSAI